MQSKDQLRFNQTSSSRNGTIFLWSSGDFINLLEVYCDSSRTTGTPQPTKARMESTDLSALKVRRDIYGVAGQKFRNLRINLLPS